MKDSKWHIVSFICTILFIFCRIDSSLEFLEEALEIREEVFGSGHIEVASNCESIGNVHFDLGDFHRAKKFYERALVIKKSSLPRDSPEIALTLNNLGNVCKS